MGLKILDTIFRLSLHSFWEKGDPTAPVFPRLRGFQGCRTFSAKTRKVPQKFKQLVNLECQHTWVLILFYNLLKVISGKKSLQVFPNSNIFAVLTIVNPYN